MSASRPVSQNPVIGDITNATLYKGAVLDIPVSAADIDGNPVLLTISGLPPFASYTQASAPGSAPDASTVTGIIRFAPGDASRGDYAITVTAQDNGDGNPNQVLVQARTFVVSVRSDSEPPIISAPAQAVALVGQPMVIPMLVRDLDQDALSWRIVSGPLGATFTADVPSVYGHATLQWTPTLDDIGVSDITFEVADSGLGPQDAGYIAQADAAPVASTRTHTIRVLVRQANSAPVLLGVSASGGTASDSAPNAATTATEIAATEGVPLAIDLFAQDAELDSLNWSAANLPAGMVLDVSAASHAGSASRATLRWTPGLFAAQTAQAIQDANGAAVACPARRAFTASASLPATARRASRASLSSA